MHDHPRKLLQKAATSPPIAPPAAPADPGQRALSVPPLSDLENPMYVSSHFSPSMIIILVVLLSAFLFMGFFAVYVRRCASNDDFSRRGDSRAGRRDGLAAAQPPGVDRSLVESFPMVSYAAVKKKGCNECVVCLTDFEGSENLRQLPKCKHVFHPSCIDMWLESHSTCPLCRRSLVNSDKWSVSLRWGGSSRGASVSARLEEDSSVRSRRGGSQTPREGGGEFSPSGPHASSIVSEQATGEGARTPQGRRRLRRSNSTGHSLLKGALSRAAFLAPGGGTPSSGCLPLSPFPLHRSRSVRLDGEAGQEEALIVQVGPAAMPSSSDESRFGGGSPFGGGGGGGGGWWSPSHEPPPSESNLRTYSRLAL